MNERIVFEDSADSAIGAICMQKFWLLRVEPKSRFCRGGEKIKMARAWNCKRVMSPMLQINGCKWLIAGVHRKCYIEGYDSFQDSQ